MTLHARPVRLASSDTNDRSSRYPNNLNQKSSWKNWSSTLATTNALSKLVIAKGIITDDEFKAQLQAERADYIAVLKAALSAVAVRLN